MASKYWIKLYHEILDDPKMGKLSDRLWRRAIELFLLAGDMDEDGRLPSLADMAWRLRLTENELDADLVILGDIGIIEFEEYQSENDTHLNRWIVTKFEDRQGPIPAEERGRQFRDREHRENYYQTPDERYANGNERKPNDSFGDPDTGTNTEINTKPERKPNESFVDTDTDTDTDTDKKQTTTAVAAVKKLLIDFGVEESWASVLASTCLEQDVKDWIIYVNGQDGITNPAGFLISRLRVGESPPREKSQHWYTDEEREKFFIQPGELPEEEI